MSGIWTPTSAQGQPSNRWAPHRQSGWTCSLDEDRFALVGGHDLDGTAQYDGGIYDLVDNAWTPILPMAHAHDWGVGVCVNGEFILWGGATDGTVTDAGERWKP